MFLELLPAVHMALDAIVHPNMHQELGTDWKWDGESITKANGFLFQLVSIIFDSFQDPSSHSVHPQ